MTAKKREQSTKQITDDELFEYFDKLLEAQAIVSCRNINYSCLEILKENDRVHAVVANYLAGFERKTKHD
jgi:hypothetical protein